MPRKRILALRTPVAVKTTIIRQSQDGHIPRYKSTSGASGRGMWQRASRRVRLAACPKFLVAIEDAAGVVRCRPRGGQLAQRRWTQAHDAKDRRERLRRATTGNLVRRSDFAVTTGSRVWKRNHAHALESYMYTSSEPLASRLHIGTSFCLALKRILHAFPCKHFRPVDLYQSNTRSS